MKRNINLEEISDGRLYSANDMVRTDCNGCNECSACCQGMGNSIVLDPFDIYGITENLGLGFGELLKKALELNVVDGVILPNLRMQDEQEGCFFLTKEGRCSIHSFRPGVCRLFPLGRYYESGSFRYFLQVYECPKENKTKVKVRKWIDIPDLKRYEKFVTDWHYFLEDVEQLLKQVSAAEQNHINMYLLKRFYLQPYSKEVDFYETFYKRLAEAKNMLEPC